MRLDPAHPKAKPMMANFLMVEGYGSSCSSASSWACVAAQASASARVTNRVTLEHLAIVLVWLRIPGLRLGRLTGMRLHLLGVMSLKNSPGHAWSLLLMVGCDDLGQPRHPWVTVDPYPCARRPGDD